eukprot:CAMPEP_0172436706 /NCGR_PEP_ID=MMETSP1064-20121228/71864_1 /TAXON_ID=202472 /ORGANISM="Aulacoseira subarctica , Strain CCAP 1002/5" /LENGTH=751 /DNA_ID=CAMNT_0013185125 /DNA_START=10 /DNA_END=2265 /DNA_ORIENTATION=+
MSPLNDAESSDETANKVANEETLKVAGVDVNMLSKAACVGDESKTINSENGIPKGIFIACLLCKRKFPTGELLEKHKKKSRLHQENLARIISKPAIISENAPVQNEEKALRLTSETPASAQAADDKPKQLSEITEVGVFQWNSSPGSDKFTGIIGDPRDEKLLSTLNWIIVSNVQFWVIHDKFGVECHHCASDKVNVRPVNATFLLSSMKDIGKTVRLIAFHHFPICPYFPSSERKKIKDCFNDQSYNSVLHDDPRLFGLANFCSYVAERRLRLLDDRENGRILLPSNMIPHLLSNSSTSSVLFEQQQIVLTDKGNEDKEKHTSVEGKPPLVEGIDAQATDAELCSMPMYSPEDEDKLSPLHVFLRKHCIEIFYEDSESKQASSVKKGDVGSHSSSSYKQQRVGIRCVFCRDTSKSNQMNLMNVVFPRRMTMVHDACMSILNKHFLPPLCPQIPEAILAELKVMYEGRENALALEGDDDVTAKEIAYVAAQIEKIGISNGSKGLRWCNDLKARFPNTTPFLANAYSSTHLDAASAASTSSHPDEDRCEENFTEQPQASSSTHLGAASAASTSSHLDEDQFEENFTKISPPEAVKASDRPQASSVARIAPQEKSDDSNFTFSFYSSCLVEKEDIECCTEYMVYYMSQLEIWFPASRENHPKVICQITCRHCVASHKDSSDGLFVIKTKNSMRNLLEQKVINHLFDCPNLPQDIKDKLIDLRKRHYRAALKIPVDKYYENLWKRLQKEKQKKK